MLSRRSFILFIALLMTIGCEFKSKPKSKLFSAKQDANFLVLLINNYRNENSGIFPDNFNSLLYDPLFNLDCKKIEILKKDWIYNCPSLIELNDSEFIIFKRKSDDVIVIVKIGDL